jgi:hypothetical protein
MAVVLDLMNLAARPRDRTGQQDAARRASVSPTFGDVRATRHPCASEGIRQQHDRIGPSRAQLVDFACFIQDQDLVGPGIGLFLEQRRD